MKHTQLIWLCLRAAALNDAVDRQHKYEHGCDPGTVRHQSRVGLLLSEDHDSWSYREYAVSSHDHDKKDNGSSIYS